MQVFDDRGYLHHEFLPQSLDFGELVKLIAADHTGDLRHLELALHKEVSRRIEAQLAVRDRINAI